MMVYFLVMNSKRCNMALARVKELIYVSRERVNLPSSIGDHREKQHTILIPGTYLR